MTDIFVCPLCLSSVCLRVCPLSVSVSVPCPGGDLGAPREVATGGVGEAWDPLRASGDSRGILGAHMGALGGGELSSRSSSVCMYVRKHVNFFLLIRS